jgi:hypothetical protein
MEEHQALGCIIRFLYRTKKCPETGGKNQPLLWATTVRPECSRVDLSAGAGKQTLIFSCLKEFCYSCVKSTANEGHS